MKSQIKSKPYLTPNEVAELLMVSPVTVRQWAQKGRLKAMTTPGGHRRFLRQEVERFVREHGLSTRTDRDDSLRILIVDDDAQLTRYLVALLSGLSADVVVDTASDGFEAGRKVQIFQPHVILLDLMMPGLSGFDVCRTLKDEPATKPIRIIAMTGYPTQENIDLILAAGAETCLAKPLEPGLLLDAIGIAGYGLINGES